MKAMPLSPLLRGILALLLILALGPALVAAPVEARFPRPDFSSGYAMPAMEASPAPVLSDPRLATALLVLALLLSGLALYRFRSRRAVRLLSLLCLLYFGFLRKGCLCPIGAMQNVAAGWVDVTQPLSAALLALFLLPLLAALWWGRLFCGAACPLGAVQDWLALSPRRVDARLDRALGLLPFLYLGLVLLFASTGLGYLVCRFDPFVAFFRFSGTASMVLVGVSILGLGVFVARPYCRYLCPYGALLAGASCLAARKVQIPVDRCVNCGLCLDACPVGAIRPPRPRRAAESRDRARRRLLNLLALAPALLALGLYVGSLMAAPLLKLHPDHALDRALDEGRRQDDAVVAFLLQGGRPDELKARLRGRAETLKRGGALLGAFWVLIFMGAVVAASRRNEGEVHEVSRSACIACGRCYEFCPRNGSIE